MEGQISGLQGDSQFGRHTNPCADLYVPRLARRRSRLLQGPFATSTRLRKLLAAGDQPISSPPRPSSCRYKTALPLTAPSSELAPPPNQALLGAEGAGCAVANWHHEPRGRRVVHLTTVTIRRQLPYLSIVLYQEPTGTVAP